MTEAQERTILAAAAQWKPDFLLEKLDEIFVKVPMHRMLKKRMSSDLLAEMDGCSELLRKDIVLHGHLDDNNKIEYAKETIKRSKGEIVSFSTNLYMELTEEIKEIEEDFKWRKTKQGKLVLSIDAWIENARNYIPKGSKKTLLIGRNLNDDDPCNIIVGGYSNEMSIPDIKKYIMSLNPPVKPLFILLSPLMVDL